MRFYLRIVLDAPMMECFRHRHIGIGQRDILSDDGDLYPLRRMIDLKDHLFPRLHIGGVEVHCHLLEHNAVQSLLLHHEGNLIDCRCRTVLNDGIRIHIAEQRNFLLHIARNRLLCAADEDIGRAVP